MRLIFFHIIFLFFVGCIAPVPTPLRSTLDPRLKQTHLEMSLSDFAQVGYAIPGVYNESTNHCQLMTVQRAGGAQAFRRLLDEKYEQMQDTYVNLSLKEKVKFWNSQCDETCSCEALQGFGDYLEALNITISKTEKRAIEKTSHKVESVQVEKCLRTASWLCESQALKRVIQAQAK